MHRRIEGEEVKRDLFSRESTKHVTWNLGLFLCGSKKTDLCTPYYKGAGTIDRHNRIRADELRMDRNLATRHWDKRFNLGVLGIICVDAYLFFQQVVHADNKMISCLEFFCKVADDLIDNNEGICLT